MGIDHLVREINERIAKLEQARDLLIASEAPAGVQQPERPRLVSAPPSPAKIPNPPRMRKLKAGDSKRISAALKKVQARQSKKS